MKVKSLAADVTMVGLACTAFGAGFKMPPVYFGAAWLGLEATRHRFLEGLTGRELGQPRAVSRVAVISAGFMFGACLSHLLEAKAALSDLFSYRNLYNGYETFSHLGIGLGILAPRVVWLGVYAWDSRCNSLTGNFEDVVAGLERDWQAVDEQCRSQQSLAPFERFHLRYDAISKRLAAIYNENQDNPYLAGWCDKYEAFIGTDGAKGRIDRGIVLLSAEPWATQDDQAEELFKAVTTHLTGEEPAALYKGLGVEMGENYAEDLQQALTARGFNSAEQFIDAINDKRAELSKEEKLDVSTWIQTFPLLDGTLSENAIAGSGSKESWFHTARYWTARSFKIAFDLSRVAIPLWYSPERSLAGIGVGLLLSDRIGMAQLSENQPVHRFESSRAYLRALLHDYTGSGAYFVRDDHHFASADLRVQLRDIAYESEILLNQNIAGVDGLVNGMRFGRAVRKHVIELWGRWTTPPPAVPVPTVDYSDLPPLEDY